MTNSYTFIRHIPVVIVMSVSHINRYAIDVYKRQVVCNDVVITHELTMKIQDDGTIQYVGNRILDNGIDNIPRYQYRLGNLQN